MMMEIDRMSYIFGSFTRRRQSQEVGSVKRRSIEPKPLKISHDRSRSTPHNTKKYDPPGSPRAKSVCNVVFDDSKFRCPICRQQLTEPRVLPCLHTFCLLCLQQLEATDSVSWQADVSDGSSNTQADDCSSPKGSVSGGSGYVSDRQNTASDDSRSPSPGKGLRCPACGVRSELPAEGAVAFPPNYLLQHRMMLATLNSQNTHLLCDICPSEITAYTRCMDCALNFCHECEELHLRQKAHAGHDVLPLDEAKKKGITTLRRQIMCMKHPDVELSLFCGLCFEVICRGCLAESHRGHPYEPASRAAKSHLNSLRLTAERAKSVVEQSAMAATRLHSVSKQIETQCSKVQGDVEKFIDNYIKSVIEHRERLIRQVNEAKEEKLRAIQEHKLKLQKKLQEARDVANFLEDLLNEGTDVEVLSFLKQVLTKMERCKAEKVKDITYSESLQFLPDEEAPHSDNLCPLYGVITARTVCPKNCYLDIQGLQNLRVGKKAEVLLETRDKQDARLERGGEMVTAEIRHRDSGISRSLNVNVDDIRDGTYCISFVPDVAGKLVLNVNVKGQPIKDNPFPFVVRTLKPHHGTFHCCSFCSSGGSKEATCGCEGRMPGGYKGCGHGHEGHPGRRHWSCCGNVLEHSECTKSRSSSHYQFTL